MIAALGGGGIYTSQDSGDTWIKTGAADTNFWISVASSASGNTLVALASPRHYVPGEIAISTNTGATWSRTYDYAGWHSVACSANGTTLAVASYLVSISTNLGTSWVTNYVAGAAEYHVTCSATGEKVVAAVNGGGIYHSTDSGANWTKTDAPDASWGSIASSADGTRLVAAVGQYYAGQIYASSNSGVNWLPTSAPGAVWASVALSADGNKVAASTRGGGIYTWQTTPTPVLNITPSGSGLLISWIVPSMPFVLQENFDLATPDWTDVPTTPALNFTNLHHEVTVPLSTTNRFYRLRSL